MVEIHLAFSKPPAAFDEQNSETYLFFVPNQSTRRIMVLNAADIDEVKLNETEGASFGVFLFILVSSIIICAQLNCWIERRRLDSRQTLESRRL